MWLPKLLRVLRELRQHQQQRTSTREVATLQQRLTTQLLEVTVSQHSLILTRSLQRIRPKRIQLGLISGMPAPHTRHSPLPPAHLALRQKTAKVALSR